jgi:hypothetical protein
MTTRSSNIGFRVKHYRFTLPPNPGVHIAYSLTYPTLRAAQEEAHKHFNHFLAEYTRQGHYGTYRNEMDLTTRGLITTHVHGRGPYGAVLVEQYFLSEFVIEAVEINSEASGEQLGDEEEPDMPGEAAQLEGEDEADMPGETAQLRSPSPPTDPITAESPMMQPGPHFALEAGAEWTQTRLPWPSRRDDGPFRRPDDAPYSEKMSFGGG